MKVRLAYSSGACSLARSFGLGHVVENGWMTVRERVTQLLSRMPGSKILVDIYEGGEVPPLTTDYYLRSVPEEWDGPPPELVNGMKLLPVFTNNDWFTIYCIEEETGRFFAIDPEAPWPPTQEFDSCGDFLMHFLRIVRENRSEEVAAQLERLLQGAES